MASQQEQKVLVFEANNRFELSQKFEFMGNVLRVLTALMLII